MKTSLMKASSPHHTASSHRSAVAPWLCPIRTVALALSIVHCPLFMASCDDDLDFSTPTVDAPVLLSTSPTDGATDVDTKTTTITLTFDKNVFFASDNAGQITLNGTSVSKALVYGSSETLTITTATLSAGTTYTLSIPAGLITGPSGAEVGALSISFSTTNRVITTSLCNGNASAEATALYTNLVDNYGSAIYAGAMADVSWNYDNATQVYQWTGSYPAINCYDYLHLPSSPSNWIDYGDISPVSQWHEAGGIVAAMWHWNVPTYEASTDYSSDVSDFSVSDALTSGTWENTFLYEDLEKISVYLLLLQDQGIPVLWRPLHEASGGWFWWGAEDADDFIALWKVMYNYFLDKGLNNLIWVWNSCEGEDADWYPGDDYVDIVSVDIYSQDDASEIAALYDTIANQYPTKMVALSECGSVATISEQWNAGANWLWFMPWYDSDDVTHADQAWWTDAMGQSYVIAR